jgi:hypothetical protein
MHLIEKLEPTEYVLKGNECIGGKVEPTEYGLKEMNAPERKVGIWKGWDVLE